MDVLGGLWYLKMSRFESHRAVLHIKTIWGDKKDVGEMCISTFVLELLSYSSILLRLVKQAHPWDKPPLEASDFLGLTLDYETAF